MLLVEAALTVVVVLGLLAAAVLGPVGVARLRRWCGERADRAAGRLRSLQQPRLEPTGRPIEVIAHDAHRLGGQVRCPARGMSFARFEGRRRAYDAVLTEACRALEVDHLLGVLPAGPELDAERRRVEAVLGLAGLRLDDAA
jgi:hypothetical protein